MEMDTVVTKEKRVDTILQGIKQDIQDSSSFIDPIRNPITPAPIQLFNDSTREMYLDALYAHYEYRVSGFEHRKEVFAWQLFSSKLIFWTVLLLVFSGICFSGIQFYKSISLEQTEDESTSSISNNKTEIEASPTGIKVSSSVLGVIILVISLIFFYLYLVYVYPIKEIF